MKIKNRIHIINAKKYNIPSTELAIRLNEIIKDGWGDFGLEYVEEHIVSSKYLVLATSPSQVVGFASVREFNLLGEIIYYLEFTAVAKKYQGLGLTKKLNRKIFIDLIINSLTSGRLGFDTVSISPNPRVLGTICRAASYCYPSPNEDNKANDEVWEKSSYIVDAIGDPYRSFSRDHNVLEGFYDDSRELIYGIDDYPKDSDPLVNAFAEKNLDFKGEKGREFVIFARFTLLDLVRSLF